MVMTNGDLLWYDKIANLDLFWPAGPRLHGLSAEIHFEAKVLSLPGDEPHCRIGADRATWYVEERGLQVVWRWQSTSDGESGVADGWDIWLEVTNVGRRAVHLQALDPLRVLICDLRAPVPPVFYQQGWSSWTPTFARYPGSIYYTDPGTPDYRTAHQPHYRPGHGDDFISEWVTVLKSPTGCLLVGFVTAADQLASVWLNEPQLLSRCWLDGAELRPRHTVRSERLWLKTGNDPAILLEAWAERMGREMDARVGRRVAPDAGGPSPVERVVASPTGWCTWYHFFGTDEAADTKANLAVIEENDLPLDVILIDDGYQGAVGDWLTANDKFPDGMQMLADQIRASGRVAGIWTAPFGAAAESRLFAEHPEWFIHDERGRPVVAWRHQLSTECYALDPTHPGAAAWLAQAFRTMRQEWGFAFFKIDFIFAAAVPGKRYDPTATRASSLRRGLEIIRQAIGDDAFLLASGAPLGVCVGLVDGMRVGPDVAPYWSVNPSPELSDLPSPEPSGGWGDLSFPSQQNALRNSIARAAFHNRLWLNDPDCLIIRSRGNDSDLLLNQVRSQVSLVALLGGLTIDSDDLTRMRPGRLKYLHQALPPTGVSARPVDLFDHELPRTLVLPVQREWGRWWVVGLINWAEETVETTVRPAELGLPLDRYHVYNYWRRDYMGLVRDEITLPRHQRHETLVLLLKPVAEQPDLLTTTFHVCQGAVEVKNVDGHLEDGRLKHRVVLEKPGNQFGEVLYTVPDGWKATAACVDGRRRRLRTLAPGLVGLGFSLSGSATIDVEFEKETTAEQ
jgi:alpha-galactosidase